MLSRFRINEISFNRIFNAILRRIEDIPHRISWQSGQAEALENHKKIEKFRNIHVGERCVLLANGPSLKTVNFSKLKNEFTIGLNRIYILFDHMGFLPSYYVCINPLVLEQFHNDITQLTIPKFLNWNSRNYFDMFDQNTIFIRTGFDLSDRFVKNPHKALSGGGTVTYVALQLAYYMGFSEVIILGLDHNFMIKGIPNTTEIRQQVEDQDHFAPDYFPKGTKWQNPDLLRSELSYKSAQDEFNKDGRHIYDATAEGKCHVFEKVSFEDIF